jgi:O-antigen biosynthesis protein
MKSVSVNGDGPSLSSDALADIVQTGARPRVDGKFLFVGDEKLYVKGVTYGAFRPDSAGQEYHNLEVINRDFALMVESGINAVRIPHTMPPRSLLDAAENHGLKVMVGLSAEQYAGYLADRKDAPDIERVVRDNVAAVAGHPAILCYALGNEIQPSLARWLGRRTIERYLERLYDAVKDEDPGGLVTYVNYPTTEYLDLPFLDLLAFNVYLEEQDRLEAYLARLHGLAGDRPLLMSEVGLDALRNGEDVQGNVLDWQIRQTFASGCAGAFVFSWTDEWFRAGAYVDDWAFGLTRSDRTPKPALAAVTAAFADVPFADREWPRVSVVVCTFNGGRTLRATLEGIERLEYPELEVIVVDDGSTDDTAAVAAEFDVRLIRTPNAGLGSARNIGAAAATGEIVAYLDADAWPDPHWAH